MDESLSFTADGWENRQISSRANRAENRCCKYQDICAPKGERTDGLMSVYGYARVSSTGQELDIQLAELRATSCERIFCEKESDAKDNRRQLRRLLKALRPGDIVIVSAFDRLTRGGPYKTLCILQDIASRGASLAEPWVDVNEELGELFAAIVGYVTRKNREDILRRTAAGRARAKALGVRFGRKPKLSPDQREQALARLRAGEAPSAIARAFPVSCSTIRRLGQKPASLGPWNKLG